MATFAELVARSQPQAQAKGFEALAREPSVKVIPRQTLEPKAGVSFKQLQQRQQYVPIPGVQVPRAPGIPERVGAALEQGVRTARERLIEPAVPQPPRPAAEARALQRGYVPIPGVVVEPPKEEPSIGEQLIELQGPQFRQQIGGAIESLGEMGKAGPAGFWRFVSRQPLDQDTGATLAKFGEQMYSEATKDIAEKYPEIEPGTARAYAFEIANATSQMLPMLAIAMTTGSPMAGLTTMGGQVWGRRYGESREAGRTPRQSAQDAAFYTLAETIPERIPLGILMRPGGSFLGRSLRAGGAEAIQEVFTEALQTAYDVGVLDEEMTWGEAKAALRDSGIVGGGVGVLLAAISHPFTRRGPPPPELPTPGAREAAPELGAPPAAPDIEAELERVLPGVGERELDLGVPAAPEIDEAEAVAAGPPVPLAQEVIPPRRAAPTVPPERITFAELQQRERAALPKPVTAPPQERPPLPEFRPPALPASLEAAAERYAAQQEEKYIRKRGGRVPAAAARNVRDAAYRSYMQRATGASFLVRRPEPPAALPAPSEAEAGVVQVPGRATPFEPTPEAPPPAVTTAETPQAVPETPAVVREPEAPAVPEPTDPKFDMELALRAHEGTSMTPERRAEQERAEFEADIAGFRDELTKIGAPADWVDQRIRDYRSEWLKRYAPVLHARSRTMSAMITGPSKFPTRRNQKALDAEQKRWNEFRTWRDKARKDAISAAREARPPERVEADRQRRSNKALADAIINVADVDTGRFRGFNRQTFVANVAKVIRNSPDPAAALEETLRSEQRLLKGGQLTKPIFTARHPIMKLRRQQPTAQPTPTREAAEPRRNRGPITQMEGKKTNKQLRMQGWNAALEGWDISDDPYLATSTASEQWRRGWREGKGPIDVEAAKREIAKMPPRKERANAIAATREAAQQEAADNVRRGQRTRKIEGARQQQEDLFEQGKKSGPLPPGGQTELYAGIPWGKVWDWWLGPFFQRYWEPFGRLPFRQEYIVGRRLAQGDIDQLGDFTREKVYESLRKHPPAVQQELLKFLTTAGASPTMISDPEARRDAAAIKKMINRLAKELVYYGILKPSQEKLYRDRYLPQLYLKYLLQESAVALGRGARPRVSSVQMGATKRRRLTKDVANKFGRGGVAWEFLNADELAAFNAFPALARPEVRTFLETPEADVDVELAGHPRDMRREAQRLKDQILLRYYQEIVLGQVKDPAYLAARAFGTAAHSIAVMRFLDDITLGPNRGWIYPKSIVRWNGRTDSARYLMAEAQRLRADVEFYPEERRDLVRRAADEMEAAARGGLADPDDPSLYKQIPDSIRYGVARGLWVRKEIHDDLVGQLSADYHDEMINWLAQNWRKGVAWWKAGKTALSPAGQARNHVGGAMQAQLWGGIPIHEIILRYLQTWRQIINNGPWWQAMKRRGGRSTSFAQAELMKIHDEFLLKVRHDRHSKNPLKLAGDFFYRGIITGAVKAGDAYSMNEQFWKTLIMGYHMDKGVPEAEAAEIAHSAVFDYSMVTPWLRWYRENVIIGAPFATFTYKAIPNTLETIFKRPQAFVPYAGVLFALYALTAYYQDLDDEEMAALRTLLPKWAAGFQTVILPWKDQHGRFQAYDFGWLYPAGGVIKALTSLVGGDFLKSLDEIGFASNPVFQMGASLARNSDEFGREIWSPDEPTADQAMDIMSYVGGQLSPTFAPQLLALADAIRGIPNRFGDPQRTPAQAALRMAGVTVHPMDVRIELQRGAWLRYSKIRAAQERYREIAMDEALKARSPARHRAELERQARFIKQLQDDYQKWIDQTAPAKPIAREIRREQRALEAVR